MFVCQMYSSHLYAMRVSASAHKTQQSYAFRLRKANFFVGKYKID